ncbi:MAG: hypothetical protein ACJAT2_001387 [Bacteriovoracaceae bacterium]|jgi:hypothetical protein
MCVQIFKERMTVREARTALRELVATTKNEEELEHYKELSKASDDELVEIAANSQPE